MHKRSQLVIFMVAKYAQPWIDSIHAIFLMFMFCSTMKALPKIFVKLFSFI